MRKTLIMFAFFAGFISVLCSKSQAGVTVEGVASGINPVKTVSYEPASNRFIINGSEIFRNPVSREEFVDIVHALRLDDRLGVSVKLSNEVIVYGKANRKSNIVKKMEDTDNFFRAIVFAENSRLKGHTLPAGYTPISCRARERSSIIYLNLDDFVFRNTNGTYWLDNVKSDILLIPMAKYTAPDGGYLPDYDALEKGEFQKEDKINTMHILKYKQTYMEMPIIMQSVRIGQAAAFIRFLRECNVSLEELEKGLDENKAVNLQGKPEMIASAAPANTKALTKKMYADNIRRIFALDAKFGSENKVKMSRKTINDGSYVAFRARYLKNLMLVDLSTTPPEFAEAFRSHTGSWEKTIHWLNGKTINDEKSSFLAFRNAHAPFRKDLSQTYNRCKTIASDYGVEPVK